ncbi:hypothetical protein N7447_007042 [Penicillium robsamsonii]|uniref:uncharacterized protein n=1 Tax=Penicillium robsamsonii TaxID=1792511 RepID=UPI0025482BEC|nr:uncharacterized protein N7447_007042 [Penicillium robsamsonii]KAJ5824702.1 hypothetical protein N7447_007042 [Penicillium robsamsonii]
MHQVRPAQGMSHPMPKSGADFKVHKLNRARTTPYNSVPNCVVTPVFFSDWFLSCYSDVLALSYIPTGVKVIFNVVHSENMVVHQPQGARRTGRHDACVFVQCYPSSFPVPLLFPFLYLSQA